MGGPDAELWDMSGARWRLFGARYVWLFVFGPVVSTVALVAAFGHTHAGAGPVLAAWLPIVVLVAVTLLHRVFTCSVEIDATEVLVRNVVRTHRVSRADIVSIGARQSFGFSRVPAKVLVVTARNGSGRAHRVAVEVSRCPTLWFDEAVERAQRLAAALGVFADATADAGIDRRRFAAWLDASAGRRVRRSPGRPDSRPPLRPVSRPPGRPVSRPPGRPVSRPPGRPVSRPPGLGRSRRRGR